jgi:hypothetical protein
MSEREVVTASLEGMRIVVADKRCELEEYDFKLDRWLPKDTASWPLFPDRAAEWLAGWNEVDRATAMKCLTRFGGGPHTKYGGRKPPDARL